VTAYVAAHTAVTHGGQDTVDVAAAVSALDAAAAAAEAVSAVGLACQVIDIHVEPSFLELNGML
jgi:hypothetical protein